MPQHVRLVNGAALDIPDGTPNDEITSRVNTANAMIKMNVPNLIKGGKAIWDAANAVAAPAGRIAGAGVDLNPVVGGVDWGIGGLNALKAIAAGKHPALNNVPDIPTASSVATALIGAPPMPQDAPAGQRYGEAAITGALSPQDRIMSALRMIGGTGLGDVGESAANYLGGPDWAKFGRWAGSTIGSAPETGLDAIRSGVRYMFAGRQAPEVDAAGNQLDTQPTFGAYANTPGRLMEKAFAAIPGVNIPINAARQRMEDAIRNARETSAQQVNQGPLPPAVDPNSIGGNLITQARMRSASIKADASQRYVDLYNAVPKDTLVDASPIIQAINDQANSPSVSGAQKAELLARRDYLMTMMPGQPGYNGPPVGSLRNPNLVPLGQLAAFKTELGNDIQGMTKLDQNVSGPVYTAIDNTLQNTFNSVGYGPQYQQARDNYARVTGPGTVTDQLDAVGGKPVPGKPGIYDGGMSEQQAHDFLARNTQSPSALEPFVDASSPYWRATAAQFINSIGQTGQGDDFRPDAFGKRMGQISEPVLTQLLQDQGGGTLQPSWSNLRAAQVLGDESSVPVSRHGLTNAIGSLAAVEGLSGWLGHHFADAGIPAAIGTPAVLAAIGYGMQSQPMADAMAGRGTNTPLVDALYQGIPFAAASSNLNNPDDPRNQPVIAPRPASPLDQLHPAPPPSPPVNMNPPPTYNF
jgi:hypothetical protein